MKNLPCKIADSALFNTFMLLLVECSLYLDDVRHLKSEQELMTLFGFKTLPDAHTLCNWLRCREGSQRCDQALDAVKQQLLKATLGGCRKLTLDIDAISIESCKYETKLTYRINLYNNFFPQAEWTNEHPAAV